MARSKGFFGTLGSPVRWVGFGVAVALCVALFLNLTKEPVVDTGEGELVLVVPEEETSGEATVLVASTEEAPAEQIQAASSTSDEEPSDVVRVPGDDADYELLNAWRRDDGAIEITTQRTLGDDVSMTIRLVRCAPLELGLIAEDGGARNDDPEMERVVLGSAEAWMAAQACGAMN